MEILSVFEAGHVIENVRTFIEQGVKAGSRKGKNGKIYTSGLDKVFNSRINEEIEEYGEQAVGTVLNDIKSKIVFNDALLYYPAKVSTAIAQYQSDTLSLFESNMTTLLREAENEMGGGERELTEEEKEAFRKERKRIQSRIYRARKRGEYIESLPRISGDITVSDFIEMSKFFSKYFGG